jgi:hypothetical protein
MEDEVHPKKLPRLRKVNLMKKKHSNAVTNVEKARIGSEIIPKINASNYMSRSLLNKTKFKK